MQRTVPLTTTIVIAIVVAIVFYSLGSNYGTDTPSAAAPSSSSNTPALAIRRTDAIPDFATHIDSEQASTSQMLDFAVTNHSNSNTYTITAFSIFPGIQNDHAPLFIKDIRVVQNNALVARLADLSSSTAPVSTPSPVLIPPGTSRNFTVFGRVVGSYPTSTAQIAIGNIYAVSTAGSSSTPELVYKESNGVPLAPPASTTDESLESAVFLIP